MLAEKTVERRLKPRISVSFPVLLRGMNEAGQKFEAQGIMMNLSASGVYLCTEKFLPIGDQVFLIVQFSKANNEDDPKKNCLTTVGTVVRVDSTTNQTYGIAIAIDHYRFV
jgi:Tfp pilus assembly protein PilZ